MKLSLPLAAIAGAVLTLPLAAQDEPTQIVFAQYYRCDQARETRADEIIEQTFGPIFDRHVATGQLSGWGLWSHVMGTDWRRLLFTTGTDRDAMFDARAEIIEELEEDAEASQELSSICPSHDDYIWTVTADNAGDNESPSGMTLSSYFVCDYSRQEAADLILRQSLAPIFDRHVEQGSIASWAWLSHRMGGKVRRILSMSGPDAKSILNGQDAIFEDVEAEAGLAQREFDKICGMHEDYLWTPVITRP